MSPTADGNGPSRYGALGAQETTAGHGRRNDSPDSQAVAMLRRTKNA